MAVNYKKLPHIWYDGGRNSERVREKKRTIIIHVKILILI